MIKKNCFIIIGLLITIDQAVKTVIANLAMDKQIIWIPYVLRFEPTQNTNLNWIASIINFNTPVVLMLIFQFISVSLVILFYYHYSKIYKRMTKLLNISISFVIAGIICSFIDVVFWGGSLDFIGLFDWFIFDMKDVWLNAGLIGGIIWVTINEQLSKKESI